jgi:acetoin utilization deacetylase AcuC-like enzyme
MRFGHSETCLAHDPGPRHPERSDRIRAIREGLKRRHGVSYVEADPATKSTLTTVHESSYVESVRTFCAEGGGQWDADTIAVEATWDAILQSVGLACWTAERALAGDQGRQTPFSLGRPPGHHATPDDAMGFCFANNVAIAAEHARSTTDCDRVAILDWDVHHGNGTQAIFDDREEVLFASLHEEGIYPGTGDSDETGTAGTTLNVPLPAGSGDTSFLAAIDELVDPAVRGFDPDLLLVSAGFDAHEHDPISRLQVTTDGYGRLAQALDELADGVDAPLGFVLEGGYSLDVLAESVATIHEVFDGYEPAESTDELPDDVRTRLDEIASTHPLLSSI